MCTDVCLACVSIHHMHAVPKEARRGGHLVGLEFPMVDLCCAVLVLDNEPRPFARSTNAPNH